MSSWNANWSRSSWTRSRVEVIAAPIAAGGPPDWGSTGGPGTPRPRGTMGRGLIPSGIIGISGRSVNVTGVGVVRPRTTRPGCQEVAGSPWSQHRLAGSVRCGRDARRPGTGAADRAAATLTRHRNPGRARSAARHPARRASRTPRRQGRGGSGGSRARGGTARGSSQGRHPAPRPRARPGAGCGSHGTVPAGPNPNGASVPLQGIGTRSPSRPGSSAARSGGTSGPGATSGGRSSTSGSPSSSPW